MPHCDDMLHPIFSLSFQDLILCGTGLEDGAKVRQLVLYLGGHYTDDLSVNNTHLLAAKTDTAKYAAAASRKMPILRPRYVYDTWEKQSTGTHKYIGKWGCLIQGVFRGGDHGAKATGE